LTSTARDRTTTTGGGHAEARFRRVLGLPSLAPSGLA
jgi:hypothetical protein